MTNAEKYEEVFGFKADPSVCPTTTCDVCPCSTKDSNGNISCEAAGTYSWWSSEYKEVKNEDIK
jgi:hypothetical protein